MDFGFLNNVMGQSSPLLYEEEMVAQTGWSLTLKRFGVSDHPALRAPLLSRRGMLALSLLVFLGIQSSLIGAEVVDRIVAVVEGHIITLSDLREEREIRARLGEKPIDDDKTLANELVDHYLIERQIVDFPGVDVTDDEIDVDLQTSIARQGRPSQSIRDAVRKRIRIEKFFVQKFRQFIRPTDEAIRKYYDDFFVPAARNRGLDPVPPLTEVVDAVRQNVVQESLDHEVDVWLKAIRRRSTIEVFQ